MTLGVGPTFLEGVSSQRIFLCSTFLIHQKSLDSGVPFGKFMYLSYFLNHHNFCQQRGTLKKEINSILLFRILSQHWELGRERSHDIVLANDVSAKVCRGLLRTIWLSWFNQCIRLMLLDLPSSFLKCRFDV